MTRKELLERIDDQEFSYDSLTHALRAVVELHKPEQSCFDATCYCADTCTKCRVPYPCPTIQAIEKELQ